jgi:hypothetical protein
MLILPQSRRNGLTFTQVWYPTGPEVIRKEMEKATVISVINSPFDAKDGGLLDFQAKSEDWWTSYIPLALSQEELVRRMDPGSCRSRIRKSEQLPCTVSFNDKFDEAHELIQEFFRRKRFRPLLTRGEWTEIKEFRHVHSIHLNGQIVAAHVMLLDPPTRARLLINAGLSREEKEVGKLVDVLNRRLHWEEILFYKAQGYEQYDFGGIYPDPQHPFHGIGQFKTSFGGDNLKLYNFVVIKNPVIRFPWQCARAVKRTAVYLKSPARGKA